MKLLRLLAVLLVASSTAVGQPTRVWQRIHSYPYTPFYGNIQRLSPNRLVAAGGMFTATGNNIVNYAACLWFFNNNGDTVRTYRHYRTQVNNNLLIFPPSHGYTSPSPLPGGDLLVAGGRGSGNINGVRIPPSTFLTRIDSLGRIRWARDFTLAGTAPGTTVGVHQLLALPDGGALAACVGVYSASASAGIALVARFDSAGAVVWERTLGRPYSALDRMVALPDGTYALAGIQQRPASNGLLLHDAWLIRLTANGDTLGSRYFGTPDNLDYFTDVQPSENGGLLLSGGIRNPLAQQEQGWLLQLDSLGRTVWDYRAVPNPSTATPNYEFYQCFALRGGQALVRGNRFAPNNLSQVTDNYLAVFQNTANGLQPVWEQFRPSGPEPNMEGDLSPQGELTVSGFIGTVPGLPYQPQSLLRWQLAERRYLPDFCRRPPVAYFAPLPTATPDSLRVLESSAPGPAHGVLLLWHWTFPDGSTDDGRQPPPRRFAAVPAPGSAVALTVTNNLGCVSTYTDYPWGPLSTARQIRQWAAGASVFPNPAAGAATLAASGLPAGPVSITLANALGQVVRTWAGQPVRGTLRAALELGGLPPGVYAVRAALAGGGGFAKRLVVR